MTGTLYCKKHRPSDETLNRGLDSSWSLKVPGCPSKKSRGVTPASWPNLPSGLWPSWPPNNLHIYWLHHFVSSPPVSWSVVGVLVHYGCRRIIQVDAVHWWWMRRYPPYYVKRFECLENRYITVANYIIELYRECKKNVLLKTLNTLSRVPSERHTAEHQSAFKNFCQSWAEDQRPIFFLALEIAQETIWRTRCWHSGCCQEDSSIFRCAQLSMGQK